MDEAKETYKVRNVPLKKILHLIFSSLLIQIYQEES